MDFPICLLRLCGSIKILGASNFKVLFFNYFNYFLTLGRKKILVKLNNYDPLHVEYYGMNLIIVVIYN